MRNILVIIAVLLIGAALEGQTPTIFNGKPALEFVSEEGTSRIVLEIDASGYPTLVFSAAHFHVIGQCYGSLIVSQPAVVFKGSGDHTCWAARAWDSVKWGKDKRGRDCLVMRRGGQTDRVALAIIDAKDKLTVPFVLTDELAKLRTWFDDAVTDFDETYHRFRKLTERVR